MVEKQDEAVHLICLSNYKLLSSQTTGKSAVCKILQILKKIAQDLQICRYCKSGKSVSFVLMKVQMM